MSESPKDSFTDRFLSSISHSFNAVLFEDISDVQFYIKDTQGRYVQVNQVLIDNYMMTDDQEILSKTDHQLFARYLADSYVQDDQRVFRGETIRNRIELVGRYDGTTVWSKTTKTPILSHDRQVIGLAGITRNLDSMSTSGLPYQELAEVTRHIELNYGKEITVAGLAQIAHLSPRTLQRKFQAVFRMSPLQYLRRVRINKASRLLALSDKSISAIAARTGFSDHSHLTREFVRCVGITPYSYRRRYCTDSKTPTKVPAPEE